MANIQFRSARATIAVTLAMLVAIAASAPAVVADSTPGPPLIVNLAEFGTGMGPWCVYAAQDENFFTQAGIRLGEVISITGDPNIVSALISGTSDIALGSAGTIVPLANGQTDQLVVVAASEDAPVSLIAPSSITSPSQLIGKTIALSQNNGSNALIGTALINEYVGKGKWTPLYVGGSVGPRLAEMVAGKASAAYINDPADIQSLGDYHVLTRFGSRLRFFNGPVMTTRNWLNKNPDAAVRFLRAFARGCNYINDPKNRQSAIRMLAKYTPIREAVAAETYDYYVGGPNRGHNPPRNAQIDLQGFANTVDVLKAAGIITNQSFDYHTAIDSSFLERATK